VVTAVEKGSTPGIGPQDIKVLLDIIWPPLVEALGKEPDVDVLPTTLDAVSSIVDMVSHEMS
jgi:hypothetical protein